MRLKYQNVNFSISFFYYIALPEELIIIADGCKINVSEHTSGALCNISTLFAFNITCTVRGYYPNITLQFHHDSKKMETLDSEEWVARDGTKNKRIVVTAVPNEKPYVCVASNVPGSDNQNAISAQIIVLKLEESTTQDLMDTVSPKGKKETHSIEISE